MNILGLKMEEARKIVENAVGVYLTYCDEKNKGSLLRSVRDKIRAMISRTLYRLISPSALQKLKQFLIRLTGRVPHSSLVYYKYEWQWFARSNDVENSQIEIQGIEKLISEFYEAQAKNTMAQ
jgi:hypothetical protein